ncbi:MAG TPA: alpha/beta fold hydrolase [Streptosporangiaceae bacterium]|nr:alpha/beta fold hydrolase [Streptosporangiaceae bacterium]
MPEVRLAASMEGPDGAPVVILANPIGTTRAIWDAQARVLRQHFRLLRFELRGHGAPGAQSDAPPGPYSIAELGTDVLGLMREHGVEVAAYCGISIGGMTGLWLAANAPERISSLVVCCAAITPMPSRQSWLDRVALVRSGGMAAISEAVPPRWFTPDSSPASPRPSASSWTCCSAPTR